MRKFKLIFIFAALSCCLLALAACGGTKLSRPAGLNIDDETLVLSWYEVDEANRYVLEINGEELDAALREPSYSLEALQPGDYSIRVKASDVNGTYMDSDWSKTVEFTRAEESGLNYRLIDSSTAYEVAGLGSASGDVVVDDVFRGKPVTRIADGAFSSVSRLTGITIGNNVTEIGDRAFYNCVALERSPCRIPWSRSEPTHSRAAAR